jgi:hypothetical protein
MPVNVREMGASMCAEYKKYLEPLIGLYIWGVRTVTGSILNAELGDPHLMVREPIINGYDIKQGRAANNRRVNPAGLWHLSFGGSDWRIATVNGMVNSFSYNKNDKDHIELLRDLSGQKLLSVEFDSDAEELKMQFDLGGILTATFGADDDTLFDLFDRFDKHIFSCEKSAMNDDGGFKGEVQHL